MPLHDVGYRRWRGLRASPLLRWLVIAETGIRRAWQSTWLRRLLFFSWLPAIWFGAGFFIYEQSMRYPTERQQLQGLFRQMPQTELLARALAVNPVDASAEQLAEARHLIWAWLLQLYFRYPQATIMVLVIGLIAPVLISQDVRSRAFLLYFSRPLSRAEYLLGKATTVWFYLASITAAPALVLYGLGVMLSPDLDVIGHTIDLPVRILLASMVLMLPTTAFALMLSSLTTESRYAGFLWFASWILGWVTYTFMTATEAFRQGAQPEEVTTRWILVSPHHTLGRVQGWLFGLHEFHEVRSALLILIVLTTVCLAVLYRRISAPMRA